MLDIILTDVNVTVLTLFVRVTAVSAVTGITVYIEEIIYIMENILNYLNVNIFKFY